MGRRRHGTDDTTGGGTATGGTLGPNPPVNISEIPRSAPSA
eukprot:CAMPEP_0185762970 /NCGR_PEP_ID=MMETSP1174-20130828/21931_1 /TAXON_ID=35687 /ORGANISM="Dictyocha speculum, Strain CCMP1381" /LENGTH=40 /DNA_ID= /DNA_START= /DNA_END= /DNA_ORIENTATION=